MKESRLILRFFRSYFFWMLIPAISLGAVFGIMAQNQPKVFAALGVVEFVADETNIAGVVTLADEAVAKVRVLNIGEGLSVFKSGPVLIKVEARDKTPEIAKSEVEGATGYLTSNYLAHHVGQIELSELGSSTALWMLVGFGGGALVGLLTLLSFLYFKKF